MSEPPSRKAFLLRLDPAVAAAIEALAAQELRSVNGQIEWLLREALSKRGRAVSTATRTNTRRIRKEE
ncbi:MAG: toxin-antitoxin system HicB family antitoxin [Pseudomonadota bacterium]